MGIFLGIYDSPGGALILDASTRITRCQITQGQRGFQALGLGVMLTQAEAYRAYEWPKPLHVVAALGSQILFEGRFEDPAIGENGLEGTAIGYSSAVGDAPYTELWSKTLLEGFRPAPAQTTERFEIKLDNQVFIAPQKGASYASTGPYGDVEYQTPEGSNRTMVGIAFDYEFLCPTSWSARVDANNRDGTSNVNIMTLAGSGVLQSGTYNTTFSGRHRLLIELYYNAAAAAYPGETGANYLKITNLRITTSNVYRLATSLTANRVAGVNVTATVGSTAGMYVGQRLNIDPNSATGESVIVLSIGSSTQFNATFTRSYLSGVAIRALIVYADEIVKDIRASVTTLNSGQLAASDALIQSPGVDLLDEVYEDADAAQALDRLASLGDNQTTPRRWRWFVNERRLLQFRPEDDLARTWYVDVTPDTERSLKNLFNSAYGVYEEAGGRTLRTAVSSNSASVTRHGITRRVAVKVQTTSSTQAGIHRDAYIEDHKNPQTRASIPIPAVFDAYGQWHRKDEVRPGDVLVFRLLPPTLLTTITNVTRMRIGQTTYDPIADALTVEPDEPAASLEFLHLREEIGR
jgi:hypothetical protein